MVIVLAFALAAPMAALLSVHVLSALLHPTPIRAGSAVVAGMIVVLASLAISMLGALPFDLLGSALLEVWFLAWAAIATMSANKAAVQIFIAQERARRADRPQSPPGD